MLIAPNHFDRGKPFYPLVFNFAAQILGFKELAVRGFVGQRRISEQEIRDSRVFTLDRPQDISDVRQKLTKLLGSLELRCESQTDRIEVDADEIAREIRENLHYLLPYYFRATGSLLVMAHETTKNEPYHDNGPLWEFLRHCRNAATHNGLFDLRNGEPRRNAVWRNFTIVPSFHGVPLFREPHNKGLLSPGDSIRLLWDIEQAYPAMIAIIT